MNFHQDFHNTDYVVEMEKRSLYINPSILQNPYIKVYEFDVDGFEYGYRDIQVSRLVEINELNSGELNVRFLKTNLILVNDIPLYFKSINIFSYR